MQTLETFKISIRKIGDVILCDINSENLDYADFGKADGLQCNHPGDSDAYKLILRDCRHIADVVKNIHNRNKIYETPNTLQIHTSEGPSAAVASNS